MRLIWKRYSLGAILLALLSLSLPLAGCGDYGGPTAAPRSDATAPAAPTDLTAVAVNANRVTLAWTAATDIGNLVAGYSVYRSAGSGAYALLDTLGNDATAYADASALASTLYNYEIVAFDGAGNTSPASNIATVTTPAATGAVPGIHLITGRVSSSGAGLAGVLMHLTGTGTGSAVTDANGNFSFAVVNGGYLLTPTLSGYQIIPTSRAVSVADADLAGQDFSATPDGSVTGTGTYPDGTVTGVVTYPDGSTTGMVSYPDGTVFGGLSYPAGTVIVNVSYPDGTTIGGVVYPAGTVFGQVTYPDGALISGVSYPSGTIVNTVTLSNGTATTSIITPDGTITGGLHF